MIIGNEWQSMTRCANSSCSAICHGDDGKLFRLDIVLGNAAGKNERKTVYVWLCSHCARRMNPKVAVAGDTVTVLLATTARNTTHRCGAPPAWIN